MTHSAISVVNALATGKGAAIGIDLKCKVEARTVPRVNSGHTEFKILSDLPDAHDLARASVLFALKQIGYNIPEDLSLSLRIESEIPIAVGLKSSSALSVAVVESVFKLFGKELGHKEILNTSCAASKYCGASITGAYDDASASLLGGLVLTDNTLFRIVKHERVPEELGSIVLVRIPERAKRFTSSVDTRVYGRFRKESSEAFEFARKMDITQAMVENSIAQCAALDYSFGPISEALLNGASVAGLSGKGPAIAAICSSSKIGERVSRAWLESNQGVRFIKTNLVQPQFLLR